MWNRGSRSANETAARRRIEKGRNLQTCTSDQRDGALPTTPVHAISFGSHRVAP
ncbi:hypothetical protein PC119_g10286 [Phytophthora cactorum]|nr:hypothetical protein PC114_g10518 [Phytophthora cactorum]KAG3019504.1 hypothetical protein PC119_g10286 [Phytophthora cactorum]